MKHSSASLVIVASTKGTLSGLNRIAHLSGAITKFSAMLAVAALCVVSVGVSKAAANGIAEPAQTAPVAANNQAKPAAKPKTGKVTATQIDPAREAWRKAMLKAPRQKETCATVARSSMRDSSHSSDCGEEDYPATYGGRRWTRRGRLPCYGRRVHRGGGGVV
jgi:hypothetical protein